MKGQAIQKLVARMNMPKAVKDVAAVNKPKPYELKNLGKEIPDEDLVIKIKKLAENGSAEAIDKIKELISMAKEKGAYAGRYASVMGKKYGRKAGRVLDENKVPIGVGAGGLAGGYGLAELLDEDED